MDIVIILWVLLGILGYVLMETRIYRWMKKEGYNYTISPHVILARVIVCGIVGPVTLLISFFLDFVDV